MPSESSHSSIPSGSGEVNFVFLDAPIDARQPVLRCGSILTRAAMRCRWRSGISQSAAMFGARCLQESALLAASPS